MLDSEGPLHLALSEEMARPHRAILVPIHSHSWVDLFARVPANVFALNGFAQSLCFASADPQQVLEEKATTAAHEAAAARRRSSGVQPRTASAGASGASAGAAGPSQQPLSQLQMMSQPSLSQGAAAASAPAYNADISMLAPPEEAPLSAAEETLLAQLLRVRSVIAAATRTRPEHVIEEPALRRIAIARPSVASGPHSLESIEGVNAWFVGHCGADILREVRTGSGKLGLALDAGKAAAEAAAEERLRRVKEAAATGGGGGGVTCAASARLSTRYLLAIAHPAKPSHASMTAGLLTPPPPPARPSSALDSLTQVGPKAPRRAVGASAEASYKAWIAGQSVFEIAANKRDPKGFLKPIAPTTVRRGRGRVCTCSRSRQPPLGRTGICARSWRCVCGSNSSMCMHMCVILILIHHRSGGFRTQVVNHLIDSAAGGVEIDWARLPLRSVARSIPQSHATSNDGTCPLWIFGWVVRAFRCANPLRRPSQSPLPFALSRFRCGLEKRSTLAGRGAWLWQR